MNPCAIAQYKKTPACAGEKQGFFSQPCSEEKYEIRGYGMRLPAIYAVFIFIR